MNKSILDASALLALLNSEKGAEDVEKLLSNSVMSTANVAEVVAELDKKLNIPPNESKQMIKTAVDKIVSFDFDQSVEAGKLRRLTEHLGLSLGDRACIALGIQLGLPIYTADKVWSKLELDNVKVKLIR